MSKMTESVAHEFLNLTDVEKEFAASNLNEDEIRRMDQVDGLRKWVLENKEFHARTDDAYMLQFLRGCKFDVKKAQQKFRNYHQLRTDSPEWFANRDPFLPEIQTLLELGVFLPLTKLDDEGRTVIIIRTAVHNPKIHKQSDVFKVGKMILEVAARDSKAMSLYGVSAVFDLADVTLGHALQLTPSVVKRAVHAWQHCYPMRTNSMDFINAPMYVNFVLNVFKKFMTAKMRNRVYVHQGSLKNLHKKIPPSILPVEYGGTNGSVEDLKVYWKNVAEKNRDWFLEDEKYALIA